MRVKLKGVNTSTRRRKDGSKAVYYYHRATGMPLRGEPGSQEFIADFAIAEKQVTDRGAGTINDLIRRFEASPAFAELAATTKAEYVRKFKIVAKEWGSAPIPSFGYPAFKTDVLDWRDAIAMRGARREADNLASALARLGSWALGRGEITTNVLDKIDRVYRSDRSDKIWLPEHVQKFLAVAIPELATALLLAMHTGQRQGDLIALPWKGYDGTRITLTQGKSRGKRKVNIKCTEALKAHLDSLPRRGLLILLTPGGRAWKKRYLNEKWDEAYKASGIDAGLHFHDLRGTAVTMLAQAGCTTQEIVAITGHSLTDATSILDVYLSRTRELADAAIIKLDTYLKREAAAKTVCNQDK